MTIRVLDATNTYRQRKTEHPDGEPDTFDLLPFITHPIL
jgi:hypothetical protein